jgi:TRAP-type transport system periplasmic protein
MIMKMTNVLSWRKAAGCLVSVMALGLLVAGPAQAQDKKVVIKYAFTTTPASVQGQGVAFFKKRAEELSKGRIEVQSYPSAQLGDQIATMEGLRGGTLEMTEVAATTLSNFSKMWSVFALPYVFNDEAEMFRVLVDKNVSDTLNKDAEASGFKILGWWTFGSRSIVNSKRPVNTPADLKGIKLRTLQDPLLVQVIAAMGASPTPLSWSELYSALQQGTVDGFENSAPLIADNKLYEVTKYYSLTEQFRIPDPQLIGLKFFNGLPKDLQDVLVQAGKETQEEFKKLWAASEASAVKTLKDQKMAVNQVDKAAFQAAVKPVSEKYLANAPQNAKDLYEKMRKVK